MYRRNKYYNALADIQSFIFMLILFTHSEHTSFYDIIRAKKHIIYITEFSEQALIKALITFFQKKKYTYLLLQFKKNILTNLFIFYSHT